MVIIYIYIYVRILVGGREFDGKVVAKGSKFVKSWEQIFGSKEEKNRQNGV